MIYLGIDFGTSNSCIAYYDDISEKFGVVKPRVDELTLKGGNVTPTVVALNQEGQLFAAGYFANVCSQVMGSLRIDKVKLWIGKPFQEIHNDSRLESLHYPLTQNEDGFPVVEKGEFRHNAEHIVSYFLEFLITEAYQSLKKEIDFENQDVFLVVTYPAYYLQNQVDAIRDAVDLAFEKIDEDKKKDDAPHIRFVGKKLIPEPLATICAAIFENKVSESDKSILVIDEGAGTLDVMLVNLEKSNIEQLGNKSKTQIEAEGVTIGGMERLGGVDMDKMIYLWLENELNQNGIALSTLNSIEKSQLMNEIEDAKISLAMDRTEEAQIRVPRYSYIQTLTKPQFVSLISPIIDECKDRVDKAIIAIEKKRENFNRKEISKVILIGGPTQMPLFKEKMYECISIHPVQNINPMEYVALGAAVSPSVRYKVPVERSYGLIRRDGDEEDFDRIIEKDTILPTGKIIRFKPTHFESKITIEVAQVYEENEIEIICKKMGKYEYYIPPQPVMYFIIFRIDEERKVDVAITDSELKANRYLAGNSDNTIFRLQFSKETENAPSIIPKNKQSGLNPIKMKAIKVQAPTIFQYLGDAYEQMTVCPLVLNYDIEEKNREHLENLKHDIEIQFSTINNEIRNIYDTIDIVDDKVPAEDLAKIREWATILSGSQDFRNLVKTTSIIKRLLTEIGDEVRYGSSDIADLAEKISKTETMAIELIRRENKKIPENIKNEIKNIMNDLDKIKKKLDEKRNSYILVISQDGKMFRDGASKEQMLINYIHGFS